MGERFLTRGVTLSEGMILDFALVYDPQPFHIDAEAARQTIYGGLIASGFQTLALGFRLVMDTGLFHGSAMGSPGFDELRWLKPVRPGDTLHLEGEVVELVPSRTKPQGIARVKWTAYNQNGEAVYTFNPIAIVPTRPA